MTISVCNSNHACQSLISLMRVLGGQWWFLTEDLDDRVILNVMDDLVWPKGRYPESFMLISLLEKCQELGDLHWGTWRMLRVPDRRLGGQGHPWCRGWPCLTQRKIPRKFHGYIFIRRLSGIGGQEWWYLEDIEVSWQKTLRTGSSLMLWMILFDS